MQPAASKQGEDRAASRIEAARSSPSVIERGYPTPKTIDSVTVIESITPASAPLPN